MQLWCDRAHQLGDKYHCWVYAGAMVPDKMERD
jgi:hypothetical protein